MKIEHIALWAKDLERMKSFYCTYFQAVPTEKYNNNQKQFSSYFLKFENGARLEIMHKPDLNSPSSSHTYGWAHIAISTGSKEDVDKLTERLREDGYTITGNPRTTGDGYYESTVLDPEGNQLEITE